MIDPRRYCRRRDVYSALYNLYKSAITGPQISQLMTGLLQVQVEAIESGWVEGDGFNSSSLVEGLPLPLPLPPHHCHPVYTGQMTIVRRLMEGQLKNVSRWYSAQQLL